MRSRRSIGQWSATTDGARHGVSWCPHSPVQTHSGSRCSTARRKARCPALAYGLPLGRRARSPCALHVGHAPTPSWMVGHPGLGQTRLAIVLASFGEADDVAVWAHPCAPTVHQGVRAHVAPLLGHASASFHGVAKAEGRTLAPGFGDRGASPEARPNGCRSASGRSVVRRHRPFRACMGAAWSVVVRFAGPYVRCRMPTVGLRRLPELAVGWCPRGRSLAGRGDSTSADPERHLPRPLGAQRRRWR